MEVVLPPRGVAQKSFLTERLGIPTNCLSSRGQRAPQIRLPGAGDRATGSAPLELQGGAEHAQPAQRASIEQ
ncbi:MAG: hypothetical protein ACI82F_003318 [Planctomycetota bacterium]|jgi:hypothetical protein